MFSVRSFIILGNGPVQVGVKEDDWEKRHFALFRQVIRDRFPRMDPHIAADLSALDTAVLHSRLSELGSYL